MVLRRNDKENTGSLVTFYATQFEKNYTNVARAGDILDYFLGRDTNERRASYLGVASDGYVTRPNRMSPSQAAAYESALAAAMTQISTHSLSPYAVKAYEQCAQEVRSIGAKPIFLITPNTTQIDVNTASAGELAAVMAFNSPRAYPDLYRSSVRRDGQHLTRSGSEEFTRIVAANFVELARAGGIK
jgi:acetylglutamate synthase